MLARKLRATADAVHSWRPNARHWNSRERHNPKANAFCINEKIRLDYRAGFLKLVNQIDLSYDLDACAAATAALNHRIKFGSISLTQSDTAVGCNATKPFFSISAVNGITATEKNRMRHW